MSLSRSIKCVAGIRVVASARAKSIMARKIITRDAYVAGDFAIFSQLIDTRRSM